MEAREKEHIEKNLRDLLELIRCNTGLIAVIQQTGILDRGELADLDAISSEYKKTKELLEILKGKTNGYTILLNAVSETKQSGAETILRQLPQQQLKQTHQNPNPVALANMPNSRYRLVFGNDLNMAQILQRLTYELVRCLPNRNSNEGVIMQLESLLVFDSEELDPIKQGQYQTEQRRMIELFEVIRRTDDDGILQCLEKLCDLDGLNVASRNIREKIEAIFPGSVQPRT